jgi:hypothetical protein
MHTDDFRLVKAYDAGYADMQHNIDAIGFSCALAMFNDHYPPGQRYNGSDAGYYYMKGEFAALFNASESGKLTVEQTQAKFGNTLTDHQAAVYTELHNCE